MKTKQLIEIENVKGANRVLKNLLERTRTEIVGIGLFYGKPGLGKTRWMTKTAMENGFIYLRLEVNITTKDFLRELLTRLLHKTMPYYQVKGTQNEIYNQILDILQRDQNITILIDELDYAFNNEKILESIRDMADQSLATFVLAGMETSRERLLKHSPHFFSRTCATHLFRELSFEDTEMVIREICD
ncbi:MAG: ATP-binding protein, partial [Candidatus Cloacimonetes bacterium]|nr:ATP-binding protein [Candidatus Cloacimonadota bacterium]